MSKRIFLSTRYEDEEITAIIEQELESEVLVQHPFNMPSTNLKTRLSCIDPYTGKEHILSKGDLSKIRNRNHRGFDARIRIEQTVLPGHWREESIGYSQIRVDEDKHKLIKSEFGSGKKAETKNAGFTIDYLTLKQIEHRKQEIKNCSLEKRGEAIEKRVDEIYAELKEKYPQVNSFKKKAACELIRQEEKPIYESLNKEIPDVKSYLKYARKMRI